MTLREAAEALLHHEELWAWGVDEPEAWDALRAALREPEERVEGWELEVARKHGFKQGVEAAREVAAQRATIECDLTAEIAALSPPEEPAPPPAPRNCPQCRGWGVLNSMGKPSTCGGPCGVCGGTGLAPGKDGGGM